MIIEFTKLPSYESPVLSTLSSTEGTSVLHLTRRYFLSSSTQSCAFDPSVIPMQHSFEPNQFV
jgi:hypothetical protein